MKHNLVRVHSCYSIKDGLHYPSELAEYVSKNELAKYLPLTDLENVFGYVKHYRACLKHGLSPVFGVDISLSGLGLVTLIAKNNNGFYNLKCLITILQKSSFEGGGVDLPSVSHLLTGLYLFLDQDQIELLNGFSYDDELIGGLDIICKLDLLKSFDPNSLKSFKIVPSLDVYFNIKDNKAAHDVRVCIQQKELMKSFESPYSSSMCFHSESSFDTYLPDDLSGLNVCTSDDLFSVCDVSFDLDVIKPPSYEFTDGKSELDFISDIAYERFENIKADLKADFDGFEEEVYLARLKRELEVISSMNFCGYFAIVWDYVNWAKSNDVPVGPGRGSGAGSMVAFLLGIVDLDPIKYNLLFERFLNPERASMPDFDIDFCSNGRDKVVAYVKDKFGFDKASQICTFGAMKARSVLRDVGRVLEIKVDKVAKSVPQIVDITLEQALDESEELSLYANDEEYAELFDYALKLEGVIRSVGKHAAGVVISNDDLNYTTPLYFDESGSSSVMLDMSDSEAVGLVKFDFLGLSNLTIIDNTVKSLKCSGVDVDINNIDLDDPDVYRFLARGITQGTFQLMSQGMRGLIKRLKPDSFEDVIALVALFRPGPLQSGMVDNFISRKHGEEAVSYPDVKWNHDCLREVLSPTYGIILYQEQVMEIARVMAGFDLARADLLRRAMGKKKPEEMAKQKTDFVSGSVERGIDADLAAKIFELVEKFAGYGFNRSHSAVYGLIAYQTVYLKYYYPAHYMSAVLTHDQANKTALSSLVDELSLFGLKINPPDINVSRASFSPLSDNLISFGLVSIKGIGVPISESIVAEREANGKFKSLTDLVSRVSLSKSQFEALFFSGSLNEIVSYPEGLEYIGNTFTFDKAKYAICVDEESIEENVIRSVGVSFTAANRLATFTKELELAKCFPLGTIDTVKERSVVLVGGYVTGAKLLGGKTTRFVGQIQDQTGKVDFVGWSDFVEEYSSSVNSGGLYIFEVRVGSYQGTPQLTVLRSWDMKFVRARLGL
ncbi:DNA polymerase III subunit alpha [Pseudoalteromonas marina]|uniref:DNA polymerase III subunit alpha n=1 Tax=Pseudoalteromonas marina TaxID=267375 RepID=A0ABT9FBZ8_9GAMM|nr:DNA polymerase III subunit alpha [Pseudoalteromonas marina]MDP2564317.1 DNA polymerase III subunit alpha [Pseudoalteromonas marina]